MRQQTTATLRAQERPRGSANVLKRALRCASARHKGKSLGVIVAAVYVNARGLAAALLCMSVSVQPAAAFDVIMVPTGNNPVPVSQNPADPEDSPEEIAKDAARDLKDTRFYNKPGATRAEYDAAWQECRLIARGSRTPGGTIPYYYNPAVVSPIAAGVGAGLGGLIAGAIAEGEQRRANRRQCLLIRGWRQVTVSPSQAERVKLMTDEERDTYFNSIVGAEAVDGEVLSRTGFTQYTSPEFPIDAPFSGDGAVFVDKKVDPAAPIAIAENEGLLAFGFRRTADGSAGRSVGVNLMRYDIEGRDLVYRPKDWKKKNDRTTYSIAATHGDKKAVYEVRLIKVTAGDYVLHNMAAGTLVPLTSNCFGAPTLRVGAGGETESGAAAAGGASSANPGRS